MRIIELKSLSLVGMAMVLAPAATFAQAPTQAAAPAGYAQSMYMGMDGKPVAAAAPAPKVAPAPKAAPHKHRLRTLCASCAKKQDSLQGAQIVACAHSKNGVCPACRTLLEMPGTVTMGAPMAAPAAAGEAPGRAMVSSGPAAPNAMQPNQYAAQSAVYTPGMGAEPTPIGVMQTNYAPNSAMSAAQAGPSMMPGAVPTASSMMPGHAVAESSVNPAPFQHKPTSSKNPHIIGHILGFRNIGAEWRDQQEQRKTQAHASIPYNNEGTTINELPSSMVYGGNH